MLECRGDTVEPKEKLMLKKSLPLLLIALSLHPGIVSASAGLQEDKEAHRVAKLKEEIVRRSSTGEKKVVRVRLLDGREIKGYIAQAGEDKFLMTDEKTGQSTSVAYAEVKQIRGKGLSTFQKVAIGWVAAGLLLTIVGANN
ncbi:MAG TPA: hypothetical protein VM911_09330 [Pyrinomonadaceae bacterium]|jgi:hypothetical protein|nr:hypothetical protein [Pyrinomonadaceae bacterium]